MAARAGMSGVDLFAQLPAVAPTTRLLWEAIVDIAEKQDLGPSPLGARAIVPILGGDFRGGPGFEDFAGVVLPGGADRQLLRADGAKELDALYEMQVTDGSILTLRNRVVIDETGLQTGAGPRYALSFIQINAPQGHWDWLNRRRFVGTMASAKPMREAVVIRGWLVSEGPA